MVQLLDVTAMGPVIVETTPALTVMVPTSSPVHLGWVGMPFGATAMVYGSDVPVSVPVSVPFSRTVPLGKPMRTGPVTDVPDWVSVPRHPAGHVLNDEIARPAAGDVRLRRLRDGVLGVVMSLQPHNATAQMRAGRSRTGINETGCRDCACAIVVAFRGGLMRKAFRLLPFALVACGLLASPAAAQTELKVGDQAPDFTLQGTDGKTYTLSKDLKGRWVVLAWFPKAFTAG